MHEDAERLNTRPLVELVGPVHVLSALDIVVGQPTVLLYIKLLQDIFER